MEKPVSHEAYSTSQSSDSVESAATQISSESPLPPGKHVATTLGCCNVFWSNIVHIELEQGELLLSEMSYMSAWEPKGLTFFFFFPRPCFGLKVCQILPHCSTVNVLSVIELRLELGEVLLYANLVPLTNQVQGPYCKLWTKFFPLGFMAHARSTQAINRQGKNKDP